MGRNRRTVEPVSDWASPRGRRAGGRGGSREGKIKPPIHTAVAARCRAYAAVRRLIATESGPGGDARGLGRSGGFLRWRGRRAGLLAEVMRLGGRWNQVGVFPGQQGLVVELLGCARFVGHD